MTDVSTDTLERIKAAVGPSGWIADPAEQEPYLVEWRGLYRGRTPLVVRPASTAEVAEVVRLCAEAGLPIVPQGGNTGLVGGSVPHETGGEIVLNLSRMNRVRALDALNGTMTVEAGCVLAAIQEAAREAGFLFPLSLAAEGSCQIGGNLSTNAGGVQVLRYGNARDLVLGLEVVLADGQVWNGLRGLRKDNTGYDLKQLFIGAEGTLGVITAAVLKLFPRPRQVETALAACPSLDAVLALFARMRNAADTALTAFEMLPRIGLDLVLRHIPDARDPLDRPHPFYALIELSGSRPGSTLRELLESTLAEALEAGEVSDAALAETEAQARRLWHLRETMSEAQKIEGASIKHDISVPISRIPAFVAEADAAMSAAIPDSRVVCFGHIGDGNLHYNLSQSVGADAQAFLAEWPRINGIVHDLVAAHGGSISAEHGIGRLKRAELERFKTPVELEIMRRVKAALDPKGLFNPGKVL